VIKELSLGRGYDATSPPMPPAPLPAASIPAGDGTAPPAQAGSPHTPDGWGYDLLLYANEQLLRGSDNVTLVAFAALAFQQIRGKGELHHDIACGILLFSVLLCAIVHFAIGNAYLGRARRMIQGQRESRRQHMLNQASFGVVWMAAGFQFFCVVIGTLLMFPQKPPEFLERWLAWLVG
jgi:hypothetical protein